MKKILLTFVPCGLCWFAAAALGQVAGAPGCGADGQKFSVSTGGAKPDAQPAAGKALVYFVEDDTEFASVPKPTTRVGVDGTWLGATHGNSYLFLTLDPGEHHLCSSWQTAVVLGNGHPSAAAHFTAAAGGVYYFEMRNRWWRDVGHAETSLRPLDSDEGQLLISKYDYSASKPKK
jgi:hypothetical protein